MGLILDRGRIINQLFGAGENIKIPARLSNIPRERLRVKYDKTVVDLGAYGQIWVAYRKNAWELYVEPYADSQLVTMTYDQRKLLMNDNGVYRLRTQEEIDSQVITMTRKMLKQKALKKLKKHEDHYLELYMLQMILLALYAIRNDNSQVNTLIDDINTITQGAFPINKIDNGLVNFSTKIKNAMTRFWTAWDKLGG